MGFGDKLKQAFGKRESANDLPPLDNIMERDLPKDFKRPGLDLNLPSPPGTRGSLPPFPRPAFESAVDSATTENMKVRLELVATQIESLKVQFTTLNERIARMERMLQEIYMLAKR